MPFRPFLLAATLSPLGLAGSVVSATAEPIFMIWENRGYYLNRPYFADSFFEASTLMRMVAAAGRAEQLRQVIVQMGYRYVVVNDLLGEVFAGGYSRRDIGILRAFISEHLEPIHKANRMTLYRIKTP